MRRREGPTSITGIAGFGSPAGALAVRLAALQDVSASYPGPPQQQSQRRPRPVLEDPVSPRAVLVDAPEQRPSSADEAKVADEQAEANVAGIAAELASLRAAVRREREARKALEAELRQCKSAVDDASVQAKQSDMSVSLLSSRVKELEVQARIVERFGEVRQQQDAVEARVDEDRVARMLSQHRERVEAEHKAAAEDVRRLWQETKRMRLELTDVELRVKSVLRDREHDRALAGRGPTMAAFDALQSQVSALAGEVAATGGKAEEFFKQFVVDYNVHHGRVLEQRFEALSARVAQVEGAAREGEDKADERHGSRLKAMERELALQRERSEGVAERLQQAVKKAHSRLSETVENTSRALKAQVVDAQRMVVEGLSSLHGSVTKLEGEQSRQRRELKQSSAATNGKIQALEEVLRAEVRARLQGEQALQASISGQQPQAAGAASAVARSSVETDRLEARLTEAVSKMSKTISDMGVELRFLLNEEKVARKSWSNQQAEQTEAAKKVAQQARASAQQLHAELVELTSRVRAIEARTHTTEPAVTAEHAAVQPRLGQNADAAERTAELQKELSALAGRVSAVEAAAVHAKPKSPSAERARAPQPQAAAQGDREGKLVQLAELEQRERAQNERFDNDLKTLAGELTEALEQTVTATEKQLDALTKDIATEKSEREAAVANVQAQIQRNSEAIEAVRRAISESAAAADNTSATRAPTSPSPRSNRVRKDSDSGPAPVVSAHLSAGGQQQVKAASPRSPSHKPLATVAESPKLRASSRSVSRSPSVVKQLSVDSVQAPVTDTHAGAAADGTQAKPGDLAVPLPAEHTEQTSSPPLKPGKSPASPNSQVRRSRPASRSSVKNGQSPTISRKHSVSRKQSVSSRKSSVSEHRPTPPPATEQQPLETLAEAPVPVHAQPLQAEPTFTQQSPADAATVTQPLSADTAPVEPQPELTPTPVSDHQPAPTAAAAAAAAEVAADTHMGGVVELPAEPAAAEARAEISHSHSHSVSRTATPIPNVHSPRANANAPPEQHAQHAQPPEMQLPAPAVADPEHQPHAQQAEHHQAATQHREHQDGAHHPAVEQAEHAQAEHAAAQVEHHHVAHQAQHHAAEPAAHSAADQGEHAHATAHTAAAAAHADPENKSQHDQEPAEHPAEHVEHADPGHQHVADHAEHVAHGPTPTHSVAAADAHSENRSQHDHEEATAHAVEQPIATAAEDAHSHAPSHDEAAAASASDHESAVHEHEHEHADDHAQTQAEQEEHQPSSEAASPQAADEQHEQLPATEAAEAEREGDEGAGEGENGQE